MPVPFRLATHSALVAALALVGTMGGAALAQDMRNPRPQPSPEETRPTPTPDDHAPQPEGSTVPPGGDLSHSGGVVAPPPTHDPSVVKPPGTPGGNPRVEPK